MRALSDATPTILYRQGDATTTTTGDATTGDATSGGEECAAVGSVRVIAGELEGVRGPAQVTTRASVTMPALVSTTGTTPTSTTLLRLSCHRDTNPAQTFTPILLWDATLTTQGAIVELPVPQHVISYMYIERGHPHDAGRNRRATRAPACDIHRAPVHLTSSQRPSRPPHHGCRFTTFGQRCRFTCTFHCAWPSSSQTLTLTLTLTQVPAGYN